MTVTIPHASLAAVGRRHNIGYAYADDWTVEDVRELAAHARASAADSSTPGELLAEADDLDALADRYERESR